MRHPCHLSFALRLEAGRPDHPCGELEHVLTGERQQFEGGEALLAALRQLLALPTPQAAPPAGGA